MSEICILVFADVLKRLLLDLQRGNSVSARPPADLIPACEGGACAGGPNSVAGNPGQTSFQSLF